MCPTANLTDALRRAPSGKPARILVVDDEPLVRRWVERVLVDAGYQVATAADGAAALAELSRDAYELLLSDVTMPHLDGLSVLSASIAKDPTVPVVLMTGAPGPDFEMRALAIGASKVLLKPMPLHSVTESVGRLVRLRRLQELATRLPLSMTDGEGNAGVLRMIGPASIVPGAIQLGSEAIGSSELDGPNTLARSDLFALCAELGITVVAAGASRF